MTSGPDIAFIVTTYNRSDALLAVLRGLASQVSPDDLVVIADDGSRHEHVQALRGNVPEFACEVRHVWHPDVGFTVSRSRNLGALAARPWPYLVFMDGDCVPSRHFAKAHRELAEPGHFVNGSRVLLGRQLTDRVVTQEVDPQALGPREWLRLRWEGQANKLTHLAYWPEAPARRSERFRWHGIRSCNLGVWADDYHAINGYDESFTGWGHEDADLVLRLHAHGVARKNGFLATEVFHLWHPESPRASAEQNRQRVLHRMRQGTVRAERGLAEAEDQGDAVVTSLNET